MDNMEDSEINAKTADSAYSNSCSNSQSRRSHSSKSTRSGSSGSSGYCGKPSTPDTSNNVEQSLKKDKKTKKTKLSHAEVKELSALLECKPPEPETHHAGPNQEIHKDVGATAQPASQENATETFETPATERKSPTPVIPLTQRKQRHTGIFPILPCVNLETICDESNSDTSGFSCAVCMHDGVVMYTTQRLTENLGYPKEMWIGRSFIDFIHPQDRSTLSTQIINGLAVPTFFKNYVAEITKCTIACRIRRYRSLRTGFEVVQNVATYKPFYLRFSFKEMLEDNVKVIYLIIKATPINSSYTTPNESIVNPTPFVIKHSAVGVIDYADVESVPYLGYLPQDMHSRDALLMYHPEDLPYLKYIYEQIVKEGVVAKTRPYRMLTSNGDYIKLTTEWSSFINPWSKKLEFVYGKHYVVEGPTKPNVFLAPPPPAPPPHVKEEYFPGTEVSIIRKAVSDREEIRNMLNKVLTKPAEKVRQQISKRCHDITQIMESLLADMPKEEDDLNDVENNAYERDSVMLGGISPHHDSDSKSSTGTPLTYTQLNYNENLQRYFDSHQNLYFEERPPPEDVTLNLILSAHICTATPLDLSVDADANVDTGVNVNVKANVDVNANVEMNLDAENGLFNEQSGNSSSPFELMMPPQGVRLTETLLHKHNNDMEKELAKSRKIHREIRVPKCDRSCDTRQKKKKHFDRCNAAVYELNQAVAPVGDIQHGLKRCLSIVDEEQHKNKQQCTESRKAQLDENSTDAEITDAIAEMIDMPSYSDEALASSQYPMEVPKGPVNTGPWMNPPHIIYISPYSYPEHAQTSHTSPPQNMRRSFDNLDLPTSNYTQNTESFGGLKSQLNLKSNPSTQSGLNSDETFDKTDGESSYSSFYSSFFRTESGSGTDSVAKKSSKASRSRKSSPREPKPVPPKKPVPQWMEPTTPEVMFKYQIKMPPKEAVLKANLEKIKKLEQPALVAQQLGQLYSELQLEGKAARLALEEAITSSCSSGEENNYSFIKPLAGRSAHELSMIYEADAPLPPPDVVVAPEVEAIANESTHS